VKLELLDPYSMEAERIWRDFEIARPPSYFLSWGWVENWLACLPHESAPRLAVVFAGGAPLSAFFLAKRFVLRNRVMPSRALYFNTTGIPRIDLLWIEYNGLVGHDMPLVDLLRLIPRGWDELYLPGLHERAFGDVTTTHDTRVIVERRVPSFYVDLEKARAKGYLALLSGQTRSQVRRAQREAGALFTEVARDASSAIDIYSELVALHTAQWRAKGKPGAFADPWFDRFHRRLIVERFAHGEMQLVRVRNDRETIGCLYNFVYNSRVLQYQSGLATFDNPHLKPGFVCHTAAIEHALTHGLAIYDFLAGDMRYKKSLSTDESIMVWARVQRRRLRFVVEDRLRQWRERRRAASPDVAQ
jgi:CelD/BcsL family acetyltransferase involved in cellulose biosynthesis